MPSPPTLSIQGIGGCQQHEGLSNSHLTEQQSSPSSKKVALRTGRNVGRVGTASDGVQLRSECSNDVRGV
ncbi:g9000 [Coccomyxa elongata]